MWNKGPEDNETSACEVQFSIGESQQVAVVDFQRWSIWCRPAERRGDRRRCGRERSPRRSLHVFPRETLISSWSCNCCSHSFWTGCIRCLSAVGWMSWLGLEAQTDLHRILCFHETHSRHTGRLQHRVPETEECSSSWGLFICLSAGKEERSVLVSGGSTEVRVR